MSHEDEADAMDSAEEQSPALMGLKFNVLINAAVTDQSQKASKPIWESTED